MADSGGRTARRDLALDALKGAVAGALATWAMDRATTAMYERESKDAREREQAARGGRTAYENAAEKAMDALGVRATDERRKRLAAALHWGTGVGAGVAYGVARKRVPLAETGHGTAFGAAWFLAVDEGLNTALGITPPPQAFPWQAHARGAAGHLVFGAVADGALHVMDRAV